MGGGGLEKFPKYNKLVGRSNRGGWQILRFKIATCLLLLKTGLRNPKVLFFLYQ